jgi:archaellum component FlaC
MSEEPGEKGFIDTKSVKVDKEFLRELAKIPDKQWKSMGDFFDQASEFSKSGGMQSFLGGPADLIKDTLLLQAQALFSPITNELNQFVAEVLKDEGLKDAIKDIAEKLGELLDELEEMGVVDTAATAITTLADDIATLIDLQTQVMELLEKILQLLGFLPSPDEGGGGPQGPSQWDDPTTPSGKYVPDIDYEEDI